MVTDSIHRIHFIGICGTAMGSVAAMLRQKGFEVTGSDQAVYPPMSAFLKDQNIALMEGFHQSHLQPAPDLVVIGNAVSRGNPEVETVLSRRLFHLSLPETIKFFLLQGTRNLVVTGTHGKTTTSSMLAWVFESCGEKPSFMIGGLPGNFEFGCRAESGPFWILEGDEYDSAFFDKRSKFLHYLPESVIVNNIEFDHADIFSSLEEIKISFKRLIQLVPEEGFLIVNADDPNVLEVCHDARSQILEVGFSPNAALRIEAVHPRAEGTSFQLLNQTFFLPMFGRHNVHNAAMMIALAHNYQLRLPDIAEALRTFKGIRRRMEIRKEIAGVTVIDDFAHHPTAIEKTIQALRTRFPGRKLHVLFEPRSNTTRRNVFQESLPESLSGADEVTLTEVARSEQLDATERLDVGNISSTLRTRGIPCAIIADAREIASHVVPAARHGDVLAFFSNGSFGGAIEDTIKALENRST